MNVTVYINNFFCGYIKSLFVFLSIEYCAPNKTELYITSYKGLMKIYLYLL